MHTSDVLLFGAHCDDSELWAGGTISRLVETGKRVVLAVAHHDEVRRVEAQASASILGCEVFFREQRADLVQWACECLQATEPQVLLTHPTGDPHFEHDELSRVVTIALTKSRLRESFPHRWYWFDTYYSTIHEPLPLLIDISGGHFNRKLTALRCHRSQNPENLVDMAQAMNALHGQRIRAGYAEAFRVFPLLGKWPRLRDLP